MKSAVIDLDGTISDKSHREHLIQGEDKKWREYLSNVAEDSINEEVVEFVRQLSEDHNIVILTMRSDEVKKETRKWLKEREIPFDRLEMLPEGRWEIEDHEFKREKLQNIDSPRVAIDDKEKNCSMFLDEGLEVYNVEDGKLESF